MLIDQTECISKCKKSKFSLKCQDNFKIHILQNNTFEYVKIKSAKVVRLSHNAYIYSYTIAAARLPCLQEDQRLLRVHKEDTHACIFSIQQVTKCSMLAISDCIILQRLFRA